MKTLITALLPCLLLTSCAETSNTPSQVAERYWQAIQQGDTKTAQQMITDNSQKLYDEHISSLQNISINNFVVDNSNTTVTTIINPEAGSPGDEIIFDTGLTFENNQWKINLNNTQVPTPSDKEKKLQTLVNDLSKSIQNNVDSMEDVISESMGMINDALRSGSEQMGQTMLEAMKELNQKMRESIGKMKERREKQQSTPKNTGDDAGEGLI